jgi:hypothetical protein
LFAPVMSAICSAMLHAPELWSLTRLCSGDLLA